MHRAFVAATVLAAFAAPAFANTQVRYPNFSNVSALTFAGNATTSLLGKHSVLQLVPNAGSQSGAVTLTAPITLGPDGTFHTGFRFRVHGSNGPWADGMTFVMAASRGGLGAPAASGGGLGYYKVTNSLAVEFDTYYSYGFDAASNEVAVITDGSISVVDNPANSWGQPYGQGNCEGSGPQPAGCLADGNVWTAYISYSGGLMNVTVQDGDNTPVPVVTNYAVDLISFLGGTAAYVGFTASTGADEAAFQVIDWRFDY